MAISGSFNSKVLLAFPLVLNVLSHHFVRYVSAATAKYPRAHKCRPQNCLRRWANSCNILYAVFPFNRCTRRLIVTCGGTTRRDAHGPCSRAP